MLQKGSFSPDFFFLFSLAFLLSSLLFFINIGGVLDQNILFFIMVNIIFISCILLILYSMIQDFIKPNKTKDKNSMIGSNFVFVLLNLQFIPVLIIIFKYYPSTNLFVQFAPYYLAILSLYIILSIIWYTIYFFNRYRNGNLPISNIVSRYCFITQYGLMDVCILNTLYYSTLILNSDTGYDIIFILIVLLLGTFFSTIYLENNEKTAYYYRVKDIPQELKKRNISKEEYALALIGWKTVVYNFILNAFAVILIFNLVHIIIA